MREEADSTTKGCEKPQFILGPRWNNIGGSTAGLGSGLRTSAVWATKWPPTWSGLSRERSPKTPFQTGLVRPGRPGHSPTPANYSRVIRARLISTGCQARGQPRTIRRQLSLQRCILGHVEGGISDGSESPYRLSACNPSLFWSGPCRDGSEGQHACARAALRRRNCEKCEHYRVGRCTPVGNR